MSAVRFRLPHLVLSLCMLLLAPAAHAAGFHWQDADGNAHSLDEWRGKPLIVHLWASWCPPCRKEMPQLARWMTRHPGARLLVVSLDRDADAARAFLQRHRIALPVLTTDSNEAFALGARALPSTILIRADGSVARVLTGDQDWSENSATVRALLQALR